MFRIEIFVDDKKLPAALKALVGIAHGQPNIMPVVNVKKQGNGALVAKSEGRTIERFAEALQARKGEQLSAADIRAMMKQVGRSESSYSYFLTEAQKAGLIKKTGKGRGTMTRYTVI